MIFDTIVCDFWVECIYPRNDYCFTAIRFAIYDRWGEQVFETTDPALCWDGTYKGNLLNTAVFIYYLDATLRNGEKFSRKGNISLIR